MAVCRAPGDRRQTRRAFLITTADGPDYLVGIGGPVASRLVGWLRTRRGCDTTLLADVLGSCPSRPVRVWRRPGGHLHAIPGR